MRLIAIIIGTLATLVIGITMARIWGESRTYASYPQAYFTEHTPTQLAVKAQDIDNIKEISNRWPHALVWVDVRASRDKELFILSPERDNEFLNHLREAQRQNPQAAIFTGGRLSDYPWEQINEFYKSTPSLLEIYKMFPQTRFILNIVDNVTDIHLKVTEALEADLKPDKRTFIQSDATIILSSIKGLRPQWVYGTGVPDIVRLLSMDSMFILSTTQFKGDVFVAPLQIKSRPAFNADILAEMRKRFKPVFLGPLETDSDFAQAQEIKPDVYIFSDYKKVPPSLN